jgi:RHS repeat-associated protein
MISEYGPGMTATIQPKGTDYVLFTTESFVVPAGSYTLTFEGLNPATIGTGNTNTALVDDVQLNGVQVTNGGFETPSVQNYQIAPTGSSWSYSGSSGIAANGGTMTSGNPPAPEGNQVAFIQNDGSLWKTATVAAGTYTLSFKAAQRSGNETYQQLRVNLRPSPGPTSVKTFVWSGNTIAEERDSTGANVTKRFFAEGEQRIGGTDAGKYYYTRDHLGSVREVSDSGGLLKGQYDYDAWGNSVVVKGKMQVNFGYTGHYFHQPSGLNLSLFRAYSPTLGRWISRDPIGENGGINLYAYVLNDPVDLIDPMGLECCRQEYGDCLAKCIEKERFDLAAVLGTAITTLGFGTMPKTEAELRALGGPPNPYTSQPSRWAGRLGGRSGGFGWLRDLGRSAPGRFLGTASTGALVFEGFYDLGAIGRCSVVCVQDNCAY